MQYASSRLCYNCTVNSGDRTLYLVKIRVIYESLVLQALSQGPPVSAVVYAAAGRWAQHRSSGAVVTVYRVRRRLQIFRLIYLLYGIKYNAYYAYIYTVELWEK